MTQSRPVAVVLRPGKTPGGVEVRAHLRRRCVTSARDGTRRELRSVATGNWPEAMSWCENNGIDYIFGLSGTKPLARKVDELADDIRTRPRHREPGCSARLYPDAPQGQSGIANGAPSPGRVPGGGVAR